MSPGSSSGIGTSCTVSSLGRTRIACRPVPAGLLVVAGAARGSVPSVAIVMSVLAFRVVWVGQDPKRAGDVDLYGTTGAQRIQGSSVCGVVGHQAPFLR